MLATPGGVDWRRIAHVRLCTCARMSDRRSLRDQDMMGLQPTGGGTTHTGLVERLIVVQHHLPFKVHRLPSTAFILHPSAFRGLLSTFCFPLSPSRISCSRSTFILSCRLPRVICHPLPALSICRLPSRHLPFTACYLPVRPVRQAVWRTASASV